MDGQQDRVEAFESEIRSLKLRAGSAEGEKWLLLIGIAMGVAGVALAVLGGVQTAADSNEFNQRAAMATGSFIGIALLIGGAALFIRYSLARYLRFWLVRLVHESRANTDRIVEAIERGPRSGDSDSAAR